jgi:hypothetical protein
MAAGPHDVRAELDELLESLQRKNVRLWVDQGDLHYLAAPGALTHQEREALRAFKARIVTEVREGGLALSPPPGTQRAPLTQQQRIYLDRMRNGHLQSRRAPILLQIEGRLNVEAMQCSVRALVRRHSVLRTRLIQVREEPEQWIDDLRDQYLEVLDVTGIPQDIVHQTLKVIIDSLCNERCDVTVGPLFAAKLIKLTPTVHVLFIAIHHIIFDGSTLALLFRELWSSYGDVALGCGLSVSAPPMQNADYARWQQLRHHAWMRNHRPYWLKHLAGAQGIRWPRDPIGDTRANGLACVSLPLGPTLTNQLRDAAQHARTLPVMALIAVFAAVVSRTCDQKDFVVTTTVHGRDLPEHEGLAGYCSHSVYLLMQLRTDERFYDLLRYVTDEFQRAMEHKDFGGIVEEHPQLRAGTLFQWLPWQRLEEIDASQAQEGQSDQLKVKRFELPFQFKHDAYYPDIYDLVWTASNTNNGILVQIFYRSEMFSATTVAQFASDFLATAERLAGDLHEPAVRIAPFDAERVSLREARHSLQSGGS